MGRAAQLTVTGMAMRYLEFYGLALDYQHKHTPPWDDGATAPLKGCALGGSGRRPLCANVMFAKWVVYQQ
ncbi:hypothetical protein NDU88_001289 [Pleurodeles waltl]|uniref:Uncharacterized protein n=1 Tax=Pleurodeles waltl TaxID=8319 RepID=A0AAV7VW06_PLEWA|nr:hypothetical protein NDU88_001289 [Pleurodeles waltl]